MKLHGIPCIVIALAGCGGAGPSLKMEGAWPLASAHCAGEACTCRNEGEKEQVSAGAKRFELRLARGVDKASIAVDGKRALARAALAQPEETCVYLDLPPGRHVVTWREEAKVAEVGIQPVLTIAEYGPAANAWYKAFELSCTTNEGCLKDDMRDAFDKLGQVPRGLVDPCGSTRFEHPRWEAEHSPSVKLEDVTVEVTLHVYQFATRHPPGSDECRHTAHGE